MMKVALIISDSYYYIKDTLESIYKDFDNIVKINFEDCKIDDLLYEFSSVSLFDDKKYVIVENADNIFSKSFESEELEKYLNNPSDITDVIFVCKKAEKTNKYYKLIDKNYKIYIREEKSNRNNTVELKNYIKKHGSNITDKSLNYIKDACLNNYDLMLREADKLLILGKENISDELVYNLVPVTPDGNNRRFIDALLTMDEKEALKCVSNMETLNIDISKMIALIAWNVRVIYLIKKYRKDRTKLNEIMNTYNIKDFAYNGYVTKGNIRSEEEFENLLISLAELDTSLKSFSVEKEKIGYYLVNLFCA